jgi:ubiquinone/menaquinone biosynthesis C-methylase UbiE
VREAVGDAHSVVNVGAGSGSYEPSDLRVVAIEPSPVMLAQRPAGSAPAVQAVAEGLPFRDGAFDCATALLTVHHWTDPARGFAELRRVARRQVVLTWDPALVMERSWLFRDYLPEAVEREEGLATLPRVLEELPGARVVPVPVARDCADGFAAAYWARPQAYLDPAVRAGISAFALLDPAVVDAAMARLAADLEDGTWARRCSDLLDLPALDVGYRLAVAG